MHDALDAELPRHGELAFVQGETTLNIDTEDDSVRAAYHAQFAGRDQAWQRLASRLRCTLSPLNTLQPPVEQLRSMLGTASVRRPS